MELIGNKNYNLHNFASGQKLYASLLNEVDQQIADNLKNIVGILSELANIPTNTDDKMFNFELRSDNDMVGLYYNDMLVSSCPLVHGTYIPCTAFTVSTETLELIAGGANGTIEYDVQPIDTTQAVAFSSSDSSIAAVTSQGVVVPKRIGSAIIHARIANFNVDIPVLIKKKFTLVGNYKQCHWLSFDTNPKKDRAPALAWSNFTPTAMTLCYFPATDLEEMRIPAGCTLTVTINETITHNGVNIPNGGFNVRNIYVVKPNGSGAVNVDNYPSENVSYMNNVTLVTESGRFHHWVNGQRDPVMTWSYTNNSDEDMYFGAWFAFDQTSYVPDIATMEAVVDDAFTVSVG